VRFGAKTKSRECVEHYAALAQLYRASPKGPSVQKRLEERSIKDVSTKANHRANPRLRVDPRPHLAGARRDQQVDYLLAFRPIEVVD
jgi:hypothetical protein